MSSGSVVPPGPTRGRLRVGTILWALIPALSLGLLAPVPFAHAAVRLKQRRLWAVTAAYAIGSLGWLVGVATPVGGWGDALFGIVVIALMVVGTAHAFVLRGRVFAPPSPAVAAALAARKRREDARAIATRDVALAGELRIGRPELPRQVDDGGLVDVNHVPAQVLVDRLGLSPAQAGQVVQARERLGGFAGPEELIAGSGLSAATVNALRERLLFVAVDGAMDTHDDRPERPSLEGGKGVPPPGWYPDPQGGPGRRWWDGAHWADHVAVPTTPPAKPRQAWPRLLTVIALVVGLGLGATVWRSLSTRGQTSGPGGLCFPPASAGQSLANQDTDAVYDVAFSPDGKTMATGSCNDTVRLWDVASHHQLGQPLIANHGFVRNVAFSPDGKTLATGGQDGKVRLWDIASRQQLGQPLVARPNPGPQAYFVTDVAFSPDGKTVAAARYDRAVRLWDVASHHQLGQLGGYAGSVLGVAFSLDGKTIAAAGGDGTVRLWDAASHQQIGQPLSVGTDHSVYSVAFSPDGTTLASAGFDRTVRLWDLASHRQIGQLTGHSGTIYSVAFSPDGTTVASADHNGAVRLWDVASHRQIGRLTGHTSRIFSVVFSPDGKTLASASQDHTMRVWDVASHRQIWQEGT